MTNSNKMAWADYLPPSLTRRKDSKVSDLTSDTIKLPPLPIRSNGSILVDIFHKYKHADRERLRVLLMAYGGCEFIVQPSVKSPGISRRFLADLHTAIGNPKHFFDLFPRLPMKLYFPCSLGKDEYDRAGNDKV